MVVVEGRRSAALELRRRWNERGAARGGRDKKWADEGEEAEAEAEEEAEARMPPHSLSFQGDMMRDMAQGDMAQMLQWARRLRSAANPNPSPSPEPSSSSSPNPNPNAGCAT